MFVFLPLLFGGGLLLFARRTDRSGQPVRWPRLVMGNLLVLLFLVSFLPPAGEIYYRFFYDTTDALYYTKVSQRWFQRHWHTNSNGIRDNMEYPAPLTPGKRRITFIGDSFTAGHGIRDIEDRFVNRIRRAHPEWEVHMIAMPGFDTGNELESFTRLLQANYEVDIVVLVYCLNDISDMMPEFYDAVNRLRADARQSGWLQRNSYFVNILYHRLNVRREPIMKDYFSFVGAGYRGPLGDRQKERLKALHDLVQSHKGRLVVVTFPFLNALGSRYDYRDVHAMLDRYWQTLHVAHLDLLPLYEHLPPQKMTISPYDAHPNEYASRLAADAMDAFLSTLLTGKPAGPAKAP